MRGPIELIELQVPLLPKRRHPWCTLRAGHRCHSLGRFERDSDGDVSDKDEGCEAIAVHENAFEGVANRSQMSGSRHQRGRRETKT